MSDPSPPGTQPRPARLTPRGAAPASTVPAGLRCTQCGYDLGGLGLDANCPECGAGVERSLHGDRLAFADPEWARAVLRGVRCTSAALRIIMWVIGGLIALMIIGVLVTIAGYQRLQSVMASPIILSVIGVALAVSGLAGVLLVLIGGFLMTRAEPRQAAEPGFDWVRWAGRAGPIVTVGAWSTAAALQQTARFTLGPAALVPRGLQWLGWMAIAVTIAGLALVAGRLTRRCGDGVLASRAEGWAKALLIITAIVGGVSALGVAFATLGAAPGARGQTAAPGAPMIAAGFAPLLGCGGFLFALIALGRISSTFTLVVKRIRQELTAPFGEEPSGPPAASAVPTQRLDQV